jgi:enamine deaminase RidA (YjgF/YER057c/UK114 family)
MNMSEIVRIGNSRRWSDVVIHGGVARWVEVAEDHAADARGQIEQVLRQIDATLAQVGSDPTRLLEVLIFLADLNDVPILNELWDDWVPPGHAPIRACVQAGLATGYRVDMLVMAGLAPRSQSQPLS